MLPVGDCRAQIRERGICLVVRSAAHVVVERAGEEDVLLGRGLRGLRERDRRVPHLLAGFLSAAQGVHLGLHDLLHQRLGRGDLLRRGHGEEGEGEEGGEEREEHGFHWGLLFLAV